MAEDVTGRAARLGNPPRPHDPSRPLDPVERRAQQQTALLDEIERHAGGGVISQERLGELRAIEASATDWRVAKRARDLRGRLRVQPLGNLERAKYLENAAGMRTRGGERGA